MGDKKKIIKLSNKEIEKNFQKIGMVGIGLVFLIMIINMIKTSFFGEVTPDEQAIFQIVFLLLMAVAAEVAVAYLNLQSVITLMFLGILISPGTMDLIWTGLEMTPLAGSLPSHPPELIVQEDILHLFAQLGGLILLFKVGMHSKIEKVFTRDNLAVASIGIIVPFAVGYAYASMTGGEFAYAMFMGAALAATSVGITVAILRDLKVLDKKFSEVIIGAAILDDILALLVLSIVVNLATATTDIVSSLAFTVFNAIIFIIGGVLTGKYVVEYIDKKPLKNKRFLLTIAYVFFMAYAAEMINLSAIVGAFLAGIILNKSRHYESIEDRTQVLEVMFTPIFFLSLGLLVDLKAIFEHIVPVMIITALALASKLFACGGMAKVFGLNFKESSLVGFGMAPRGEVALIVASIGMSEGILSLSEYSILSAMALLTSLAVPSILTKIIKSIKDSEKINLDPESQAVIKT